MKRRRKVFILLRTTFFLLIFALTAQSQQRPMAGQVTQEVPQPPPVTKAPPIDPNTLRRLQGIVSRSTMINTLMGNQETRMTLENLAKSAKVQPGELATKAVDGSPVPLTPYRGDKSSQATIDELNWSAGIKISMIKNRPYFYVVSLNVAYPLGEITSGDWRLTSTELDSNISNDVFYVDNFEREAMVRLGLFLPLSPSPYIITVQTDATKTPKMYLRSKNSAGGEIKLYPLSTRDGFCGIAQIVPHTDPRLSVGTCVIDVKFQKNTDYRMPFSVFSGFTILRP